MNLTLETLKMETEAFVVIMFINKLWVMKLYTFRHTLWYRLRCYVLADYAIPYI